MIIEPRTGEGSAMSASRTTAWYQLGKFGRFPSIRVTLKARIKDSKNGAERTGKLLCFARSRKN
jgi:hypothetical protein